MSIVNHHLFYYSNNQSISYSSLSQGYNYVCSTQLKINLKYQSNNEQKGRKNALYAFAKIHYARGESVLRCTLKTPCFQPYAAKQKKSVAAVSGFHVGDPHPLSNTIRLCTLPALRLLLQPTITGGPQLHPTPSFQMSVSLLKQ